MKTRTVITALIILLALAFSCGRERPTVPDGENNLRLYAIDTSGTLGDWTAIEGATIRISSSTHQFAAVYETGPGGFAVLDDLVAGSYTIQAELVNEEELYTILGQKELSVLYAPQSTDTVFMNYQQSSPLTMNEVYYCGCNRSRFYYYDQFIELYNSSPDTIWLDGYLICRNTNIPDIIDPEAEDYALAYYVHTFPGERGVTRECPIAPGQFLVIACDAYDHTEYGGSWCVDLSGADWEFFNPLGSDVDFPEVPNLLPVSNYENDFGMNIAHAAIYIATGEEWEYGYHYDEGINDVKEYIHIPLWTIVDAVEFARNTDSPKYITIRLDAGLAGIGVGSYAATSVQRRFPGLDSNNSTFDFEKNFPPTPGWQ
jgi:hypothetical protein